MRTQDDNSALEAIDRARRAIDAIDDQLVVLLERRAACALEIGRAKGAAGVPVRDEAREAAIVARLRARTQGALDGRTVERVFERIFEAMRELETGHQPTENTRATKEALS